MDDHKHELLAEVGAITRRPLYTARGLQSGGLSAEPAGTGAGTPRPGHHRRVSRPAPPASAQRALRLYIRETPHAVRVCVKGFGSYQCHHSSHHGHHHRSLPPQDLPRQAGPMQARPGPPVRRRRRFAGSGSRPPPSRAGVGVHADDAGELPMRVPARLAPSRDGAKLLNHKSTQVQILSDLISIHISALLWP